MPRGPRPARRPGARSTSAVRSTTCSVRSGFDIVHVHDPFAPSAASVALRHSRSLNVGQLPRAHRADPLDPGRPAAGRDLLRAARCPHGQLPRDVGADGAVLPGHLRAGGARARLRNRIRLLAGRRPGPDQDGRQRPVRIAFCLEEERGALAPLPARAAPPPARALAGRRRSGCPDAGEVRIARRLRDRVHILGPRDASPEELIAGRRRRLRRLGRPASRARAAAAGARLGDGPRGLAAARCTRSWSGDGRARAAVPARRRDHARGPAAAADRRAAASPGARPRRPGARSGTGTRSSTRSRRSTAAVCARRHDPDGDRAVRRRLVGPRVRSTSTSTCTPTTRRTARPRSRCFWRPRRTGGSARSRSPTTTRSPARWRRASSPRRWAASR